MITMPHRRRIKYGLLMLLVLVVIFFMLNMKFVMVVFKTTPKSVCAVIDEAGDNGKELLSVIEYYKQTNQSEKLEATYFLIQNIFEEGSVKYQYVKNGNAIQIDSSLIKNLANEVESGLGYFEEKPFVRDIDIINSKYLKENIDLAFKTWKSYSWCKELTFNEFCNTLLPYRIATEPLSDWRMFYFKKRKKELDSLNAVGASMSEVCFFINQKYQRKYLKEASAIPGDFSYLQFESIGGGTCNHLAFNAVLEMRACGIPLNYDIVCYHGRINGGHIYNSIYDPGTKRFIFFSPYEREPERREWRAHKIMRLNFVKKQIPITRYINDLDKIPDGILKNPYYTDVTDLYFPCCDVEIKTTINKEQSIIFLCTYNRGGFYSIAWGIRENDRVQFKNLTKELLYFPMYFVNDQFIPASEPFILRESGVVTILKKESSLISVNGLKIKSVNKNITQRNKKYSLFYWNNRWIYFGDFLSDSNYVLNIKNVPSGALYKLHGNDGEEKIQRPFSFIDNRIEYW